MAGLRKVYNKMGVVKHASWSVCFEIKTYQR